MARLVQEMFTREEQDLIREQMRVASERVGAEVERRGIGLHPRLQAKPSKKPKPAAKPGKKGAC
jgi:hypothetical protein